MVTFVLLSFVSFISLSSLQGNARIINYTGIVRGATQRLVKQELEHEPNDQLIERLDGILSELQTGRGGNGLTLMEDSAYQSLLTRMQSGWRELKAEILEVRNGADQRPLYQKSEEYFELADDTVSAAEVYAENSVRHTRLWLVGLIVLFLGLVALFLLYNKRQKRLSVQLELAENASREKSGFLSKMSHEIRTPMNGIMGMTAIAKLSLDDRDKLVDCLDKIDLSSRYLLSLINDVLDMSRIENGRMELQYKEFDLAALLDGIRAMLTLRAQEKHIEFEVRADGLDIRWVTGDELRLNQILINLLTNAIKFTPENGRVALEVSQTVTDNDEIRLECQISDTGVGMSEDFMQRMFEPFEQEIRTDTQPYVGTGLGLAISYHLVKLINGQMTVDSRLGEGTRFLVSLPLKYPAVQELRAADTGGAAPVAAYDFTGVPILIAEDNEINAEITTTLLEHTGAVLTHVWNGKEAVEAYTAADSGTYRLILMDMQMPVMNGMEAAQAIRASGRPDAKQIPIIALTADAFLSDRDRAMQSGMNGYLSKPIELERLCQSVAANL